MLGNTLLFCGGQIDLDFTEEYLADRSFDTVVCADSGLDAAYALKLPVDYIMGDFDSVTGEVLLRYQKRQVQGSEAVQFVRYPAAKDATDTEMVIEWLVARKPAGITLLGATGGRLDHLLANLHVLAHPLAANIPAWIIDRSNRVRLADRPVTLRREDLFGKYISLVPLTEKVYPVTLEGFVYPLSEHILTMGSSLGVSNEMAQDVDAVKIFFEEGILILIESRD